MRSDFCITSIGSYYNHNNIRFEYFIIIIIYVTWWHFVQQCHYTITPAATYYSVCYKIIHTIIYANCFRSITLIGHLKRLRYVLFNRQICLYFFHQINNHYIKSSIYDAIYFANAREWFCTNHRTNRRIELWYK